MLRQDLLSLIIRGDFSLFKATVPSIGLNRRGNASKHLFIIF